MLRRFRSPPRPTPDGVFRLLTAALAAAIVLLIGVTGYLLLNGSLPVLERFGINFVTGVDWVTTPGQEIFGILPYILGTLVTAGIAIALGVPISVGIAVFLAEMSPSSVRTVMSQIIELLAAVPSVIYGLWGLFVFRFWIKDWIETPLSTYLGAIPVFAGTPFGLDILTASLILTIMIIPTISSISKEVMMAVPISQREAAYAVGATRWEVVRMSVLSYARSGIFGAAILGLGRAVGETMAVTMVIGNAIGPIALPRSLIKPGQTLSSLIANNFNEADPTSLEPAALIGVGLVLFGLAAAINIVAQLLVWRVLKVKGGAIE